MPSDLDKMMSFPFYVFATVCFIILFVFAIVIYDRQSKILTIVVSVFSFSNLVHPPAQEGSAASAMDASTALTITAGVAVWQLWRNAQ